MLHYYHYLEPSLKYGGWGSITEMGWILTSLVYVNTMSSIQWHLGSVCSPGVSMTRIPSIGLFSNGQHVQGHITEGVTHTDSKKQLDMIIYLGDCFFFFASDLHITSVTLCQCCCLNCSWSFRGIFERVSFAADEMEVEETYFTAWLVILQYTVRYVQLTRDWNTFRWASETDANYSF